MCVACGPCVVRRRCAYTVLGPTGQAATRGCSNSMPGGEERGRRLTGTLLRRAAGVCGSCDAPRTASWSTRQYDYGWDVTLFILQRSLRKKNKVARNEW